MLLLKSKRVSWRLFSHNEPTTETRVAGGAHQTIIVDGKPTPDYATVQGIFIGVVAIFTLLMTVIGPEYVFSILV